MVPAALDGIAARPVGSEHGAPGEQPHHDEPAPADPPHAGSSGADPGWLREECRELMGLRCITYEEAGSELRMHKIDVGKFMRDKLVLDPGQLSSVVEWVQRQREMQPIREKLRTIMFANMWVGQDVTDKLAELPTVDEVWAKRNNRKQEVTSFAQGRLCPKLTEQLLLDWVSSQPEPVITDQDPKCPHCETRWSELNGSTMLHQISLFRKHVNAHSRPVASTKLDYKTRALAELDNRNKGDRRQGRQPQGPAPYWQLSSGRSEGEGSEPRAKLWRQQQPSKPSKKRPKTNRREPIRYRCDVCEHSVEAEECVAAEWRVCRCGVRVHADCYCPGQEKDTQIRIVCNKVEATLCRQGSSYHVVTSDGRQLTPSKFELEVGMLTKNWRLSFKARDTGEPVGSLGMGGGAHWLCEVCAAGAQGACCAICGESGGAMKRVHGSPDAWAHVQCTLKTVSAAVADCAASAVQDLAPEDGEHIKSTPQINFDLASGNVTDADYDRLAQQNLAGEVQTGSFYRQISPQAKESYVGEDVWCEFDVRWYRGLVASQSKKAIRIEFYEDGQKEDYTLAAAATEVWLVKHFGFELVTFDASDDETIESLSARLGVPEKVLMELNAARYEGLTRKALLMEGTQLLVPSTDITALYNRYMDACGRLSKCLDVPPKPRARPVKPVKRDPDFSAEAAHKHLSIRIVCNGVEGTLSRQMDAKEGRASDGKGGFYVITMDGRELTPGKFELEAGSLQKNWRQSFKVKKTGEPVVKLVNGASRGHALTSAPKTVQLNQGRTGNKTVEQAVTIKELRAEIKQLKEAVHNLELDKTREVAELHEQNHALTRLLSSHGLHPSGQKAALTPQAAPACLTNTIQLLHGRVDPQCIQLITSVLIQASLQVSSQERSPGDPQTSNSASPATDQFSRGEDGKCKRCTNHALPGNYGFCGAHRAKQPQAEQIATRQEFDSWLEAQKLKWRLVRANQAMKPSPTNSNADEIPGLEPLDSYEDFQPEKNEAAPWANCKLRKGMKPGVPEASSGSQWEQQAVQVSGPRKRKASTIPQGIPKCYI